MVVENSACYCKFSKMDDDSSKDSTHPEHRSKERPFSANTRERSTYNFGQEPIITSNLQKSPLSEEPNESIKKLRPLSRRGVKESPSKPPMSAIKVDHRSISRSSSVVSSENNQSKSVRPSSSMSTIGANRLQGTASRLASAISQQTGPILSFSALPTRPATQFSSTDRLVTQQGLSRARSSVSSKKGPGTRLIQDKRYYEGILQIKMREITNEINQLKKEIDDINRERSMFFVYDKQVKQLAAELTELQGKLADYNVCFAKIHTTTDVKEIEQEYQIIEKENKEQQNKLEITFSERTKIEQQIHDLENEIEKEKFTDEKLIQEMPIEMREKYASLCDSNVEMEKTINNIQQEMLSAVQRKAILQKHISNSTLKLEAADLQFKIMELEDMKSMLEEGDFDQENILLDDSKMEIASMERAIDKLKEDIDYLKKESENIQRDLEECSSDRYQKYLELRKREETMNSFLSSFEENKNFELKRLSELKQDILKSLFRLSKHLITLPTSQAEFEFLKKEIPQVDSQSSSTNELLKLQFQQRKLYYQKLEVMENKLLSETQKLKESIQKMRTELTIFENLNSLKEQAEENRINLLNEKENFLNDKDKILEEFKSAEMEYMEAQKKLKENETHAQLQTLERKLTQIEQNNSALQQFIEEKKRNVDYVEIKDKTLSAVKDYNQMLISKYTGQDNGQLIY